MVNSIAEARAQGDLSENAEYDAAKEKQGFIEGRIAEIESKLAGAQVIDPTTVEADGRVVFGATVELEDLDSGKPVKYQIVGDDEADIDHGLISISSPIARALIGKSEGDVASVQAPSGVREYEIIPFDTSEMAHRLFRIVGDGVGRQSADSRLCRRAGAVHIA